MSAGNCQLIRNAAEKRYISPYTFQYIEQILKHIEFHTGYEFAYSFTGSCPEENAIKMTWIVTSFQEKHSFSITVRDNDPEVEFNLCDIENYTQDIRERARFKERINFFLSTIQDLQRTNELHT